MPRNELLRAARLARSLTQTELGTRLGVSDQTVSNWESGRSRPQLPQMRALLEVMDVATPEALGFAPTATRRPRGTVRPGGSGQKGLAVLARRDLLAILSTAMGGRITSSVARYFPSGTPGGTRLGRADVERVQLLASRTYELERMMGGGAIRPDAVVRQFGRCLLGLEGRFDSTASRMAMHEAVARYSSIAGWSLVDQGEHAAAQRVFAAGLAASEGAHDHRRNVLRTLILTDTARQAIYRHEYTTALMILDLVPTELPGDVRAIAMARRVRALGCLGDHRAVTTLASRAIDVFVGSPGTSADDFENDGLGEDEIRSDIGHAYSALAIQHGLMADRAERELHRSIASYGVTDARSRSIAAVRLVDVHVATGDAGKALAVAHSEFDTVRDIQSSHVREGIEVGIRRAIARKREPGMADVLDVLTELHQPA